ncbi:ABC transporter permease [Actinoplanes teichomyceticus]|uniref:Putative ABC transport system permease protein n=1 Tax=Actinoplanes teichomyceticus TaxID=1867 RepID=A0A561VLY8_ACTTI|nr:ABC transporter permease [Actinoplanes teichomyceticus]TWG12620.1 putative ABC transport system permease protein [Actinoplanes teichomyceticus]GIF13990.1 hypothetical protein Ate01nite_40220 [Actinoplanes teichomyceticus]
MSRLRTALHWPSIRGRARADARPLLLSALVVAMVTVLAGAVPVLLRRTADEAVREAVRAAGDQAEVRVAARWEYDDGPYGGRLRDPRSAEALDDLRTRSLEELGPLRDVLLPPIEFTDTPYLKIRNGTEPRSFRLNYLSATSGPAVVWVSGRAPAARAGDDHAEAPWQGPPWPVQVGLSETAAARLGVRAGDRLPVEDEQRNPKDVRVSGIFRPADRDDPAWQAAPWLLDPVAGRDGAGTTRFGGLLTAASLPDARLAFGLEDVSRTVLFRPDADVLTLDSAQRILAAVVALKASSGSSASRGFDSQWGTQLDAVLRDVRAEIDAARAQATVLLAAVCAAAVLVLLLAAQLLAGRRAAALTVARQRGASLAALGGELVLESALVTVAATATGGLLAGLLAGGVAWGWLLPAGLAAVLAGPGFGVLAAYRATRDRRVPANRSARRWAGRTAALRRLTAEFAVLAAAAVAVVLLHQRGVLGSTGGTVLLPAAAPSLGVLAGALVLLRLLPALTGLGLRRALRSSQPLAVFGAARAASVAGRALPVLALATSAGLATFALTVDTTVQRGLTDGAWRTTGGDVLLDLAPDGAAIAAEQTRRLASAPGVRHAVAGQVVDGAPLVVGDAAWPARLVVVDSAAYRELLADTPLPPLAALPVDPGPAPGGTTGAPGAVPPGSSGPAPGGTTGAPGVAPPGSSGPAPGGTTGTPGAAPPGGTGGAAVPALVRSADGGVRAGSVLRLSRQGAEPIRFTAVGAAPAVDGAEDVVVVDAAAITAAGLAVEPDTIWLTGPGAQRAAEANADAASLVIRAEVERVRQDAALVTGLLRLARTAAATVLVLGLLGFALAAASGAPDRWQTLSRLRTLGLRTGEARRVAAAELLPLALLAAAGGPLLGLLLARLTLAPLGLRLVTGQSDDPAPAPPWAGLAVLAVVFPAMVVLTVRVESAVRRRQHLSEVLRVGGG